MLNRNHQHLDQPCAAERESCNYLSVSVLGARAPVVVVVVWMVAAGASEVQEEI